MARFITFEGGEGVGKSTQIKAVAKALQDMGIKLVVTREPGGSEGAEAIRNLLMDGSHDRWNDRAEALLFAAARADHVEKTIKPALARGEWVLCDRFIDSSRAYQGAGGGISDADILTLHRIGSENILPDRSILLTVSQQTAATRLKARDGDKTDRMGSKSKDYQSRLMDRFRSLAAAEPDRWRIIDAEDAPDAITKKILDHLAEWLPQ